MTKPMDYDPAAGNRFHHFCRVVELHRRRAPWHEIAEVLLAVRRLRGREATGDMHESGFEQEVNAATGLTKSDMARMMATLERVEFFAGGWHPKNLLSDDMTAVELGARIAWHDPDAGRRALLELKEGKVDRAGLRARLSAFETPGEKPDPLGPYEIDPTPPGPR